MKKFIFVPLLVLLTSTNPVHARINPDEVYTPESFTDAKENVEVSEHLIICSFKWLREHVEEMRRITSRIQDLESPSYPYPFDTKKEIASLTRRKNYLKDDVQGLFRESIILSQSGDTYFNRLMRYADLETDVFPMPSIN